jgi:hypothetical protein
LLTNYLAGIFIGNGGSAIREMMDITHALVHISNLGDNYPGTKERIVFIKGNLGSVTLAQSLVWEMIGQQSNGEDGSTGRRGMNWEPSVAKNNPGEYDDVEVENRISIPQSVAGVIIGKGGAGLKQLSDECGITLNIDAKEDGEITQERLVTLSGSVAGCMKCTSLIVNKMSSVREKYSYVYHGTTYPKHIRQMTQKSISGESSDDGHSQRRVRVTNPIVTGKYYLPFSQFNTNPFIFNLLHRRK